MQTNNTSTFIEMKEDPVFVDMFYDSLLRTRVAKIPTIPNVSYKVIDLNKIFVFSKLIELIYTENKLSSLKSLDYISDEQILKHLDAAYITPIEAIEFGIVPTQYEVINDEQGFLIRHKVFGTLIPGLFRDKIELNQALAQLLVGNIARNGDFAFDGQQMTIEQSFEAKIKTLPQKPDISSSYEIIGRANCIIYANLSDIDFKEGFDPISLELFNKIKLVEISWVRDTNTAASFVYSKLKDIWTLIPFEFFNNEFAQDDLKIDRTDLLKLRDLYPELDGLSDNSLFYLFDRYQCSYNHSNSWEASREDEFLFFLLSSLISDRKCQSRITEVGLGILIAFNLLSTHSKEQAIKFVTEWQDYHHALTDLTKHIKAIMQFLQNTKDATELKGEEIGDIFNFVRVERKYSGGIS